MADRASNSQPRKQKLTNSLPTLPPCHPSPPTLCVSDDVRSCHTAPQTREAAHKTSILSRPSARAVGRPERHSLVGPWMSFPLVGVMRGAKPSIRCLASMLGSWRPVLWWGYATTTPCRSSPPSSSLNPSSQRQQRRLPRRDMCMVAAPELAPSSQSRRTLQRCLEFHGTGLHSGTKVRNPSPPKGWALGIGA